MGSVHIELVEEDERLSVELLVHKHTEDTHHSGTAIVKLLSPEVDFVSLRSGKFSESDREFGSGEVSREGSLLLLPGGLKEPSDSENGEEIDGINLEDRFMSGREVFATRESGSRPGGGISPSSQHSNASVLELNITETVEAGLVAVGDVSKGIPAAELGAGGTDFVFESIKGGGGFPSLGRGERRSGAEEGSEEGELHHLSVGFKIGRAHV